jgi:hypothetical protein
LTALELEQQKFAWAVVVAIVGWIFVIVKIILPYFFLSKKDKVSHEIEQKKLSIELQKQADLKITLLGVAHSDFMNELIKFCSCRKTPTKKAFVSLTTKANTYFDNLLSISTSIIDKTLPDTSIKYVLSQRITEAVEKKTIEKYYIKVKEKFPNYTGVYEEENYKAIFILYNHYLALKKHWWNRMLSSVIVFLYQRYITQLPLSNE